ncbi:MAG: sulfur relay protein DsrC [Gammaproteobacteria bacterium]|nr:sulfur relay protein DsrC [Gammaproteobacteria bacterium]
MLHLSEVLIQEHDLTSFTELVAIIQKRAREGEMFFQMDIKPPFGDTPDNWEERLESAFTSAR